MPGINRKFKVLVIIDALLPPITEVTGMKCVYQLLKKLADENVQLHILTNTYQWVDTKWREWVENETSENLRIYVINTGIPPALGLFGTVLIKLVTFYNAIRLCRSEKFDIVHEYSSFPPLIGLTSLYRVIFGVKTFHTICTYHRGVSLFSKWSFPSKLMNGIIVTSKGLEMIFNKNGWANTVYLPIGIDLAPLQEQLKSKNESKDVLSVKDERIILFIGPIERRKGIHTFINSAKRVLEMTSKVIFIIVTHDKGRTYSDYRKNIEQYKTYIKGNESKFRLLEGPQDTIPLLSISDLLVLPTREPHGTLAHPLTLLEAMALGKSTISTDIEGARELIRDGINGLLIKKEDDIALTQAIITLLSNNELREKLGNQAKSDVACLDMNKTVQGLMSLYTY